ncbi:hypothetical protein Y1Q_0005986 [Alligator mississippiensis]|uniref:Uncharacterized protein n=1 Tax=Alligator mississippiensis TaxID=8496 RepID=A0A151N3H4_ALLMI|nr:hypothetical protein Y1Q_0005986 [Alligator mississippiensis]
MPQVFGFWETPTNGALPIAICSLVLTLSVFSHRFPMTLIAAMSVSLTSLNEFTLTTANPSASISQIEELRHLHLFISLTDSFLYCETEETEAPSLPAVKAKE